jgi:hypothetical protein
LLPETGRQRGDRGVDDEARRLGLTAGMQLRRDRKRPCKSLCS